MWVTLLLVTLIPSTGALGAEERRVKVRVAPIYPEIARKMNVNGTVKIEVVIGSNGAIKSIRPLGGHPLFIQAASEALKKWRYEPGTETTTVIEFRFHPD
jgi:TonB family protein